MQFELTDALIDDIVFTMEDQNGIFFVDTYEGGVVGEDEFELGELEAAEEDRYIGIPDWDSSEGFRLMEQFAAGFKNKLVRSKLSAALNRGKGVFRAFKDTLAAHPEAEKLWFAYKDSEMKRAVIRWYNALREEWGLALIGEEPEETDDLLQEDFRFRATIPEDADKAAELHRLCLEEGTLLSKTLVPSPSWSFPGSRALVAETAGGDFAGYISGAFAGNASGALEITALEVRPEYRGLGIGEGLLARFTEDAPGASEICIDLPQGADSFARALLRESFSPIRTRYRRRLE
jgi:ribosomal protein S18 acetylase RimI-like enzyme